MKYGATVPVGLGEFASEQGLNKNEDADLIDVGVCVVEEEEEEEEEDKQRFMMIGGARIDMDDEEEGTNNTNANAAFNWEYGKNNGDDDDDDDEEIGSSSSEYTTEEDDFDDFDEDDDGLGSDDSEEYGRQLRAIAGMALDTNITGTMVPSPPSSFGMSSSGDDESDSDDWMSKRGRQKAIAKKKKAKAFAQKQMIEDEELETYVQSAMETLMYLGEGSYVGLPPGMTKLKLECVRDLVHNIGKGSGFVFETVGGGKRMHALLKFTQGGSYARRDSVTYNNTNNNNTKNNIRNKSKKGRALQQNNSNNNRKVSKPVSFVQAGTTDLMRVESSSSDDDDEMKEKVMYANRGLRRAAEAEAKAKALRKERKKKSQGVAIDAGRKYAEFENHGSGIGSKLMEKMGFMGQGTGLGAKRDGKAEPVEAVIRKKRAGLGT